MTVKGDLRTLHMPFSHQIQTSFEADYDFPFSTYRAEFPKVAIDRPLAAPLDDVIGCLVSVSSHLLVHCTAVPLHYTRLREIDLDTATLGEQLSTSFNRTVETEVVSSNPRPQTCSTGPSILAII